MVITVESKSLRAFVEAMRSLGKTERCVVCNAPRTALGLCVRCRHLALLRMEQDRDGSW